MTKTINRRNPLDFTFTNALSSSLVSSLGGDVEGDGIVLPVKDGLQFHITSFEVDKTKDQLVTVDGSDKVSIWHDISGNGRDAVQSNTDRQPLYNNNYLPAGGGLPAIFFDDVASTQDGMTIPDLNLPAASEFTIFSVFNTTGGIATRRAIQSSTNNWLVGPYNASIWYHAGSLTASGTPYIAGIFDITAAIRKTTEAEFYINGVYDVDNPAANVGPITLALGAGGINTNEGLEGYIVEVIVYDRVLSQAEREATEEYLAEKWDIDIVTVAIVSGRVFHVTTFQFGKVKSQLVTVDGADAVSTWIDQSGNGNDAVQSITNRQPIFTTNLLNGHPAIVFDGISDFFEATGIGAIANNPYTIFLIVSPEIRATPTYDNIIGWYDATFNNASLIMASGNPTPGSLIQFDADLAFLIDDSIADEVNVISITLDSANTSCWKNGVAENTVADLFTATATQSLIGADYDPPGNIDNFFQGKMGEILVYNRVLTAVERQIVESYLATKWDVTLGS